MRKTIASLMLLLFAGSLASAQVLTGALPNDVGQLSFALFGGRQSNVSNTPSLYQSIYGVGVAYGLCPRTEIDLTYEYGGFGGVPGMEMSLGNYSLFLKYNLLEEAPVSLALAGSYTLLYQVDNFAGSPAGNNYGLKLLVSKIISSFQPYACLNSSNTSLGGLSSATEATLGGMWLANEKFTLMAENTWQFNSDGSQSALMTFCGAYTL